MKKVLPYLSNAIKSAKSKGVWGHYDIPIFSVSTMHEFNQLVGYVKYLNASNGTVLYRGQPKDWGALKPSGNRENGCVSSELISALAKDKDFRHYLGLDSYEISGWKKYQEIIISAVLQHYGANTSCMDFVDNHWCALWFGIYSFDSCTQSYIRREDKESSLYIYLYLADTNCASVHGIYLGEDTYTVDLRKALPSYFLRPASQHGWVVCGNDVEHSKDYAGNVLCVIEVKVGDAYMAGVHLCAGRESGVFVLADDCFGGGSGGGTVWDREIPYPAQADRCGAGGCIVSAGDDGFRHVSGGESGDVLPLAGGCIFLYGIG